MLRHPPKAKPTIPEGNHSNGRSNRPSVITITLVLAALGLKVTDLVKFITNAFGATGNDKKRARNDIATFLVGWFVGIAAVWVLARTAWGDEVTVGEEILSELPFPNLVFFGLIFSTVASILYDFKKAVDGGDSAKQEPLIPGTPARVGPGSASSDRVIGV